MPGIIPDLLVTWKHFFWPILADKGYQGASDLLCVMHPIRAPIREVSAASRLYFNREISLDRIIVENYFGGMTSLCTVLGQKICWNELIYEEVFPYFLAMKNCQVRIHPLQETENAQFIGVRNRIWSVCASGAEKPRVSQQRNTARRRQRMTSSNYRCVLDDSDSDQG